MRARKDGCLPPASGSNVVGTNRQLHAQPQGGGHRDRRWPRGRGHGPSDRDMADAAVGPGVAVREHVIHDRPGQHRGG
jgi:hypothetical protein